MSLAQVLGQVVEALCESIREEHPRLCRDYGRGGGAVGKSLAAAVLSEGLGTAIFLCIEIGSSRLRRTKYRSQGIPIKNVSLWKEDLQRNQTSCLEREPRRSETMSLRDIIRRHL